MTNLAIVVDSVGFSYNQNNSVLKDVNIHVPKGKIYALLGSNGCGKTTLLKILLGRLRAKKGSVHILGHKVDATTRLNHFIGYMPQNIALNPGMNIEETFFYFARVNHINDRHFVEDRIQNYLEMLDLQYATQQVGQLSGGQKRLLSLGVTMIYEPKILLLDEPTVGVDSLIRRKIWKHLNQICHVNETTVIITTHYIDEAKQSDLVGFLKEGRLLAEESPQNLMRRLDCVTLEEVFYKLCLWRNTDRVGVVNTSSHFRYVKEPNEETKDQIDLNKNKIESTESDMYRFRVNQSNNLLGVDVNPNCQSNGHYMAHSVRLKSSPEIEMHYKQQFCSNSLLNLEHMHALAYREMLLFKSSLMNFFMMIFIPLLTITLFQCSYGRTPLHVPVALCNNDAPLNESVRLSDLYLNSFNNSMVQINNFKDEQTAFDSVKAGKNVIALAFRKNFSSAFFARYSSNVLPFEEEDDSEEGGDLKRLLSDSSIHLYIDMSRTLHVRYFNRSLLMSFQHMIEEFGSMRGLNPYIFSTPIEIKQIYYGQLEPNLQPVFQAGIIICVLLATSVLMSALKIVQIRANGCLERDLNQSIKPIEYLITLQMAPLGTIFIQVLATLGFAFYIIDVPLEGSFWEAFLLVYICTFQGIFIGTLISVFSKTHITALILTFSTMVMLFFTSGVLWPVEGMPSLVQKIFLINPITLPIKSLRNIMLRGWSIGNRFVYVSYFSCLANCLVLFVVESILFHYSVSAI